MKKQMKLLLAGLSAGLLLTACGTGEETAAESADDTTWPEELVVAQYQNDQNDASPAAHSAFREHLSAELDIEVTELDGGASYAPGIEALSSGNLDVMLVTPQSFAGAQERADGELIATIDEDTDYRTMFVTQSDNDEINSLEDLENKNFAFVDANSTSGYLYPKATLVDQLDLEPNRIEESGYFFNNVALAGSHDNVMLGVSMGDYDAGAVASTIFNRAVEAGTVNEEDFKVVGESVDIPNAAYVIRGDLPEDLKTALQDAFVSFDDDSYFETIYGNSSARFTEIDASYYEPAVEAMELVGATEDE